MNDVASWYKRYKSKARERGEYFICLSSLANVDAHRVDESSGYIYVPFSLLRRFRYISIRENVVSIYVYFWQILTHTVCTRAVDISMCRLVYHDGFAMHMCRLVHYDGFGNDR